MAMVLRSGRTLNPYALRKFYGNQGRQRVIMNVARKVIKYRNYGRVIGAINRAYKNPVVRASFNRMRARYRRKISGRKQVGFPPGTTTTRYARQIATFETANNDRTLFSIDCSDIAVGTGLDQRLRDVVEFRGMRLCIRVKNINSAQNMYFHWAVISPKQDGTAGVATENFFRSDVPSVTGRGQDFDNTLDAQQLHCLPINPDKWNIITHKKYNIGQFAATSAYARSNDAFREINMYIPIKRQLRYDSDNFAQACTTPIWFVYWGARWNTLGGTAPTADLLISYRIHAYFNNPKQT